MVKTLENYVEHFAIESLSKSDIISKTINLDNDWTSITNEFKNVSDLHKQKQINDDIILIIGSDNMKVIPENFKGVNLRFLIIKKLLNSCYYSNI